MILDRSKWLVMVDLLVSIELLDEILNLCQVCACIFLTIIHLVLKKLYILYIWCPKS